MPSNEQKTHCPKGHPYDEENTYLYRGRRNCRRCAIARATLRVQDLRDQGLRHDTPEKEKARRAEKPELYNAIRRESTKRASLRNRLNVFEYLATHHCVDCGEADPIVLEFDHRDRTSKVSEVGTMIAHGKKWEAIVEEISKCDVRCANCHRRRTAVQFNWYKDLVGVTAAALVRTPGRRRAAH